VVWQVYSGAVIDNFASPLCVVLWAEFLGGILLGQPALPVCYIESTEKFNMTPLKRDYSGECE
jgi:hypothetical protein